MSHLNKHDIPKGSKVWAMIDGYPEEVTFLGLRPYFGFDYSLDGEEHDNCVAVFGATREDLIDGHIEKQQARVANIEQDVERLRTFLVKRSPSRYNE